jgi:hypothetical protein
MASVRELNCHTVFGSIITCRLKHITYPWFRTEKAEFDTRQNQWCAALQWSPRWPSSGSAFNNRCNVTKQMWLWARQISRFCSIIGAPYSLSRLSLNHSDAQRKDVAGYPGTETRRSYGILNVILLSLPYGTCELMSSPFCALDVAFSQKWLWRFPSTEIQCAYPRWQLFAMLPVTRTKWPISIHMLRTLWHMRQPQPCGLHFPAAGDNNMADAQTYELGEH